MPTNVIIAPQNTDYNRFCSKVVIYPVVTYNQFWDVYLCGYYSTTTNSKQIETLRSTLLTVWRNKLAYLGASYSLYVDIFLNQIEFLSAQ